MRPQNLTRQFYNKSPYPPPRDVRQMSWKLPPLGWILSIDRDRRQKPARALVAGCGSGSEAFLLQMALKDTAVVAVDFSAESIRQAKITQARNPALKGVEFLEADLTDPALSRKVGTGFDLILCHGVLTYIPRPESALRNLAQCLRPDGVLYLGVNGASHFSTALRPVLRKLGYEVEKLPKDPHWRSLIKMWEDIDGGAGLGRIGKLPDWYLGGDFFGPLFQNFSLQQWVEKFTQAGLFLRADFFAHRAIRPALGSGAAALFTSCTRAEVCQMLDVMHPMGFLRLLLTRQPPANPPWRESSALGDWCPRHTGLYRVSYPARASWASASQIVSLKSRPLHTQLDWPMPSWQAETLRRADGATPLRRLLRDAGRRSMTVQFAEQLFLLYHFGALNFLPP